MVPLEPGTGQPPSGNAPAPDGTPAADPRDAWTDSYRRGLEAPAIAKLHRAPRDSVRRHLAALLAADPLLWERRLLPHNRPAPPWCEDPGTPTGTWRSWFARLEAFTARDNRLPRSSREDGNPAIGEPELRLWLQAQRAAHRAGTLTLTRHTLLARIPNWNSGGSTTPILLRRGW